MVEKTMETIDDMELSEAEKARVNTWINDWGVETASRLARHMRVHYYINKFLVSEVVKPTTTPFRCYREGINRYRRKDGGKLTQEDIRAIFECSPGQGSNVIPSKDGLSADHHWFVDSSD